jgi:HK97 gp10 family phage protein
MTFDASDIERFAAELEGSPARLRATAGLVVKKSTFDTLRDAQAIVPVDTGNLKNSGGADFVGSNGNVSTGEAGFTAEYADYVETGTSRMAPQPYLVPAFERNLVPFEAAIASLGGEIIP